MFAAWWSLVASYAVYELVEASNHIAVNQSGLWRTEHLRELRQRVAVRRRDRYAAEAEQKVGFIECSVCHGSGWAVVPHPRWVIEGEWQSDGNHWPTAAVYCYCGRGQRLLSHAQAYNQDSPKHPRAIGMTLERYEGLNPRWHQQMEDRANASKDEAHAKVMAAHAQKLHGKLDITEISKRLAEKFKVKQ